MTVDLAYQEIGDGPPVVILHGLLGMARNWGYVAKKLAAEFRVFTLDLRNHGSSPWAPGMSYAEMADDVSRFITRMTLDRPAVIGHSMGGKAAMVLALNHGEQVGRLMVVDVAPVAYNRTYRPYLDAMDKIPLAATPRRSQAEAFLKDAIPEPGIRLFLLQNLGNSDHGLVWLPNLAALRSGMADIMGFPDYPPDRHYDGPTLLLGGSRSDYIRDEHHPVIRRLFPRAEIETIADAGHWVHADQPDSFVERAALFLHEACQ